MTAETKPAPVKSEQWIKGLAAAMRISNCRPNPRLRTTISSDVKGEKLALFLPPEMSHLQPENLRYLHGFASKQGCLLIEDRRNSDIRPIIEQRDLKPHKLAVGIGQMLKQTGMGGQSIKLSEPQRLTANNPYIDLSDLICMTAHCVDKSKRVVFLPHQLIVDSTGNDTHPIAGYACKVVTKKITTTISFFNAPGFKLIGYMANNQFVSHVFLGGGPIHSPQLWTNLPALFKNKFRLQLFGTKDKGNYYGLLYNTFYLDINAASTQQSRPLGEQPISSRRH